MCSGHSLVPAVSRNRCPTSRDCPYLCFPRQLMENQIGVVERGAFDDMKELERL